MRVVKIGLDTLPKKMSKLQASRYGKRNMPSDLKKAGFEVVVFESDEYINGSLFYRINYGKKCIY